MRRLDRANAAVAKGVRVLPVVGGSAPSEIVARLATTQPLTGLRFEHMVKHLHRLGPRATGELLVEIAHSTGQSSFIADRLQAYAALDPAVLRAVGGDRFPPSVLDVVR